MAAEVSTDAVTPLAPTPWAIEAAEAAHDTPLIGPPDIIYLPDVLSYMAYNPDSGEPVEQFPKA
jgi:hypothetical protein